MNCTVCNQLCQHHNGYTHYWDCKDCNLLYNCIETDNIVEWGNVSRSAGTNRLWMVGDKKLNECSIVWSDTYPDDDKVLHKQEYSDPTKELMELFQKYMVLQ